MSVSTPRPDLRALLDHSATACATRIKPASGWSVALDVETTFDEIVGVTAAKTSPMSKCIAESSWKLRLPAALRAERDTFSVAFP